MQQARRPPKYATMGGKGDKDGPQGVSTQGGEWANLGLLAWQGLRAEQRLAFWFLDALGQRVLCSALAEFPPRVGAKHSCAMGRQRCARTDVKGASLKRAIALTDIGALKYQKQTRFGSQTTGCPSHQAGNPCVSAAPSPCEAISCSARGRWPFACA